MESNVFLLQALATNLVSELETLESENKKSSEQEPLELSKKVRDFEISLINAALLRTRGNQRRAASLLGIKVTTLNTKIKNYKIEFIKQPKSFSF